MGLAKDVFLLHDGKPFAKTAARMLAMDLRIAAHNLDVERVQAYASAQVLVCCFSRIQSSHLPAIRELASRFSAPPIVLLSAQPSNGFKLAEELPGTVCLFEPLNFNKLRQTIKQALNTAVEAAWGKLQPENRRALQASSRSFQSCFAAGARGEPLPVKQV
jgi:hypothetical protein